VNLEGGSSQLHFFGWEELEGAKLASAREDGSVLTVGIFDGLHRGHQRILLAAERLAASAGLHRIHIGFQPHPDLLLRGIAPLRLLDPIELELRLTSAGVEQW
jgi:FAD synthase